MHHYLCYYTEKNIFFQKLFSLSSKVINKETAYNTLNLNVTFWKKIIVKPIFIYYYSYLFYSAYKQFTI